MNAKRISGIMALVGAAVAGLAGGGAIGNKVGRQQVLSELQKVTHQERNMTLVKEFLPDTFESLAANIGRLPEVRRPLEWQSAGRRANYQASKNNLARDGARQDSFYWTN